MDSPATIDIIEKLYELAKNHCGPYSKYALVDNPYQPMTEPSFTKDGFNIIKQYHVEQPEQKFIHKMITYLGNKISIHVGDGTTTGMMIALELLRLVITDPSHQKLRNLTFNQLSLEFDKLFDHYEKINNDYKITVSDVMDMVELLNKKGITEADIIARFAYYQSLTSSHGSEMVAEAISEMFRNTPKEAIDSVTFLRATVENAHPIEVNYHTDQYNCPAEMFADYMTTDHDKTEFKVSGATLLLHYDQVVLQTPNYYELCKRITAAANDGRPVCLLTTGMDPETKMTLETTIVQALRTEAMLAETPVPNIGIFYIPMSHPIFNDVACMAAIANKPYNNNNVIVIDNVDLLYKRSKAEVQIGNLYAEVSEIHSNLKPMYKNPDYVLYDELFNAIEKQVALIEQRNDPLTNSLMSFQKNLKRLRGLLLLNTRVSVTIGGYMHDNIALFDVVEDCVTASRKSVNEGIVPGALVAPYVILDSMMVSSPMYRLFEEAIKNVMNTLLSTKQVENSNSIEETNLGSITEPICYDLVTEKATQLRHPDLWISDTKAKNLVIQPANMDITLFKRIKEVILRLIYTVDMIFN